MWTYNYTDELYHHGVKGQKWGVRRYQNKDGSLIKRYSDQERKKNGQELNQAIERSRSRRDTGRPSAKEVWETSSTMKKFYEYTKNDYKIRNEIYDGKRKMPEKLIEKNKDVYNNDEIKYYVYGEEFRKLMQKKASEIVYEEKDVKQVMKLVEEADWNDINKDTYHDKAWLYWH